MFFVRRQPNCLLIGTAYLGVAVAHQYKAPDALLRFGGKANHSRKRFLIQENGSWHLFSHNPCNSVAAGFGKKMGARKLRRSNTFLLLFSWQ